jgi:hypothetical protein
MLLALVGAAVALLGLGKLHDRFLARVAVAASSSRHHE